MPDLTILGFTIDSEYVTIGVAVLTGVLAVLVIGFLIKKIGKWVTALVVAVALAILFWQARSQGLVDQVMDVIRSR